MKRRRPDAPLPLARFARVAVLAAASLLVPVHVGCASPPTAERGLVREITHMNRRLEESFRSGDLLGVADVYADDGLLLGPGGTRIEGREEIDAYWSDIVAPLDWRLEIHSIGGEDDLAWELGRSYLTRRRDGVAETAAVEFLFLWRRENGDWKIAVDAYWTPGREHGFEVPSPFVP